jgi:hypothetical protein
MSTLHFLSVLIYCTVHLSAYHLRRTYYVIFGIENLRLELLAKFNLRSHRSHIHSTAKEDVIELDQYSQK